jgi:hypothetical protein
MVVMVVVAVVMVMARWTAMERGCCLLLKGAACGLIQGYGYFLHESAGAFGGREGDHCRCRRRRRCKCCLVCRPMVLIPAVEFHSQYFSGSLYARGGEGPAKGGGPLLSYLATVPFFLCYITSSASLDHEPHRPAFPLSPHQS